VDASGGDFGERFRESEQRLQDILDNAPAVVYVKDLEGRYLLRLRSSASLRLLWSHKSRGRRTLRGAGLAVAWALLAGSELRSPYPASCIDCSLRAARRPYESFRDKAPGSTCCGAGWICGFLKPSMREESFLVSQAPERSL
jgi:hypothetical protein